MNAAKRKPTRPRPAPGRKRTGKRRGRAPAGGPRSVLIALGVAALIGSAVVVLWFLGGSEPGAKNSSRSSNFVLFEVAASEETAKIASRLENAGLVDSSSRFRWAKLRYHPFSTLEPGRHWLPAESSPRTLVRLLARLQGRPYERVVLPEGWDSFQIAARLAEIGICPKEGFLRLALAEPTGAARSTGNLEGYLYPASYDFRLNTTPQAVLTRLNEEAQRRFSQKFEEHPAELESIRRTYGLNVRQMVTLASIVQKEAADSTEFGNIASVFYNRLRDPDFRPRRMLQSDPTAGYGCKLPDAPASCQGFTGRITPALLRDPANRYNTYRHPGLPPGPIGNPSVDAIDAVLKPPATNFFFFVGHDGGRHTFSRTLKEHRSATKSTK